MTKTRKKRRWTILGLGCGLLFLIILVAAGVYFYAGWQGYQEAPMLVEVQEDYPRSIDPYSLSPVQKEHISRYGYPEGFTILFYEEPTFDGGIHTVRLETWDYYTQGIGFTFINGELTAEDPLEITITGALDPLPYYPQQFNAFMSLTEVIAVADIDTYAEIPLDKEFIDGGVSYFSNSLTFGLKNDELLYVEALAISSE